MGKPYTVAINISVQGGAQRNIVRGIIRYCQAHTAWHFMEYQGMPAARSPHLSKQKYDGLITTLNYEADLCLVKAGRIPMVAVNQGLPIKGIAIVCNDDARAGEMGARHFLDKGFRNFAFYGASRYRWALERRNGFCSAVKKAGFPVAAAIAVPHTLDFDKARPNLCRWLLELPRPIAIMASDDMPARHILAACREIGLQVPEQVAVLGVDNDDILCELATPPLSSVVQDCDRIGYEAAALLDRMLQGQRVRASRILIPPLPIVARHSTDVTVMEDLEMAQALRLIREKVGVGERLNVKVLTSDLCMSRRTLERRFQAALGRSPADEIRRCRLERAMLLLRTTSLKVNQVVTQSGFCDIRGMAAIFRRSLKMSPSAYRRQFRDH